MTSSEKQTVALVSMGASALLAGSKFLAAMFTGSLGILSEAVHSVIDFGATIVTYFAIRWADRPAEMTAYRPPVEVLRASSYTPRLSMARFARGLPQLQLEVSPGPRPRTAHLEDGSQVR